MFHFIVLYPTLQITANRGSLAAYALAPRPPVLLGLLLHCPILAEPIASRLDRWVDRVVWLPAAVQAIVRRRLARADPLAAVGPERPPHLDQG
jgi:hypothetical protein